MLVSGSAAIAKNYLAGWFVADLITTFPFDFVIQGVQAATGADGALDGGASAVGLNKLLRLMRLFKIARLVRLSRYLRKLEEFTKFNPGMIRGMWLILLLLLVCHIFGCLWWYIGVNFPPDPALSPDGDVWAPRPYLFALPFTDRYWHAYFWGVGVVTGGKDTDTSEGSSEGGVGRRVLG